MTAIGRRPVFLVDSPRRLPAGTTMRVLMVQEVEAHGRRSPGPHSVGKAEVLGDGRLSIWITERTAAGRVAKGLLADDVLDAVVEGDDPPLVWLRP